MRYCPGDKHVPPTKRVRLRHASLCRDCIEFYGTDTRRWPGWLRFVVEDDQRVAYRERRAAKREIPHRGL